MLTWLRTTVILFGVAVGPSSRALGQAEIDSIVAFGDPVAISTALDPRGMGTIHPSGAGVPQVTPDGAIVFKATVAFSFQADLPSGRFSIWTYDDDQLILRAIDGLTPAGAPNGPNAKLANVGDPIAVSDSGHVVFPANAVDLEHDDPDLRGVGGLWIAEPAEAAPGVPVVRYMEHASELFVAKASELPVPLSEPKADPDHPFLEIHGLGEILFDLAANVAVFEARTVDPDDGSIYVQGIWQLDLESGAISSIAVGEALSPGSFPAFEEVSLQGIDGNGRALYLRSRSRTAPPGFLTPPMIEAWIGVPGDTSRIAREGDPAPGIPNAAFSDFHFASINASGRFSLTASVTGAGIYDQGLWVGESHELDLVFRAGRYPPSDRAGALRSFGPHQINNTGQVFFSGATDLNRSGFWMMEGMPDEPCAIQKIAVSGEPAKGGDRIPEKTANFFGLSRFSLSDAGEVAFTADLASHSVVNLDLDLITVDHFDQVPDWGKSLLILARRRGDDMLHFRAFGSSGTTILDHSEGEFPAETSGEIADLNTQLENLWNVDPIPAQSRSEILQSVNGILGTVNSGNNLSLWLFRPDTGLLLAFREREMLNGLTVRDIDIAQGAAWDPQGRIAVRLGNTIAAATVTGPDAPLRSADAYWDFNEGSPGSTVPASGVGGDPAFEDTVPDRFENGNDLRTFAGFTAPTYSDDVPDGSDPENRSLCFTPNQDLYTLDAPLTHHYFTEWTVEAVFKVNQLGAWQVILGKDGKPTNLAIAPLQLKVRGDNRHLMMQIIDTAGFDRSVQSINPLSPDTWYHVAVVNDGLTMKMYLKQSGGDFVLQNEVPVIGPLFDSYGIVTIGRGMFSGGLVDWFNGCIDEVRIRSCALDVDHFEGAADPDPDPNQPPIVANPIPDQTATYGDSWEFTIPSDTFVDPDGAQGMNESRIDSVELDGRQVRQSNGEGGLNFEVQGLPMFLNFDPDIRTISGPLEDVETYTITVTAIDDGTPPMSVSESFKLTVDPATLHVTADDVTRWFGTANPNPWPLTYSGFVLNESESVLNSLPTASSVATAASPAGAYNIVPSGGQADHYTFVYNPGTLTITPPDPGMDWIQVVFGDPSADPFVISTFYFIRADSVSCDGDSGRQFFCEPGCYRVPATCSRSDETGAPWPAGSSGNCNGTLEIDWSCDEFACQFAVAFFDEECPGDAIVSASWESDCSDCDPNEFLSDLKSRVGSGGLRACEEPEDATPSAHTFNTSVECTPPTMRCRDITVVLDDTGSATISPADVDDGSADDSGTLTLTLGRGDSFDGEESLVLDCDDVGTVDVELIGRDPSGNRASCMAVVRVVDNVPPEIFDGIVLTLGIDGTATLLPRYNLLLTHRDDKFDLPEEGTALVIVAGLGLENKRLHVRIFDSFGTLIFDKAEEELDPGDELNDLKKLFDGPPDPGWTEQEIIDKATSLASHHPLADTVPVFDACGFQSIQLQRTSFDTSDLGSQTVAITAIDPSGNTLSSMVTVVVRANLTGIDATPDPVSLVGVGDQRELHVTATLAGGHSADVTRGRTGTRYVSRDPSVVTVSEDGVLTAVGMGVTTVEIENEQPSSQLGVVRDTVEVHVGNGLIARFVASPNPAFCNQAITFDASESTQIDPDRAIVLYEWDFDYDGTTFDQDATGPIVSFSYSTFGDRTVALRVTDNGSPPASAIVTGGAFVSLDNNDPVAAPGGPYFATLGSTLSLDGSASSDDDESCGDRIVSYEWKVGDIHLSGPTPTLTAEQIGSLGAGGSFEVVLTVTDMFGRTGTATALLTIMEPMNADLVVTVTADDPDLNGDTPGIVTVRVENDGEIPADDVELVVLSEYQVSVTCPDDTGCSAASRNILNFDVSELRPGESVSYPVPVSGSGEENGRCMVWVHVTSVTDDANPEDNQAGVLLNVSEQDPLPEALPFARFVQFTHDLDDGVTLHSDRGGFIITYLPTAPVLYLNLSVDGRRVLVNVPMLNGDPGDEEPAEKLIDFELVEVPGGDTPVFKVDGYFTITDDPVEEWIPVEDLVVVTPMLNCARAGLVGESILYQPAREVVDGDMVVEFAAHETDFPNQPQGLNECTPTAVSNSLIYLNDRFDLELDPAELTTERMKTAVSWEPGGTPPGWPSRKDNYMRERGFGIVTMVTTDPKVALEELRKGHDVEMDTTGHTSAIVGMARLNDGRYLIEVAHDLYQDPFISGAQVIQGGIILTPETKSISGTFVGPFFKEFVIERPANVRPMIREETLAVPENETIAGTFDASDHEHDVLDFRVTTPPEHGLLEMDEEGRWTYTPDLNYFGPDSFVVVANDGTIDSRPATISIEVIAVQSRDFGDAPDTYGTLAATSEQGASHLIDPGFTLGASIDEDENGQPSADALGDDSAETDDEDGVTFLVTGSGLAGNPPVLNATPGAVTLVDIVANVPAGKVALLNAWADFDGDGEWATPGEQIFANVSLVNGVNHLQFVTGESATPDVDLAGQSYVRFRLSSEENLGPTGSAPDGEVEDYLVVFDYFDFGDAPASYGTLASDQGAHHAFEVDGLKLGTLFDWEGNGQPSDDALQDDHSGEIDDEDGVTFVSAAVGYLFEPPVLNAAPGAVTRLDVFATVPAGKAGLLQAWLDFDGDGHWNHHEQIFANVVLVNGNNLLEFVMPDNVALGQTYLRFRLSSQENLLHIGGAPDGEVEDYAVVLEHFDFGDAPATYGVVRATSGASHIIRAGFMLGAAVDGEVDGQPSDDAFADGPDEDGVMFVNANVGIPGAAPTLNAKAGATVELRVEASVPAGQVALLNAWLDVNRDGDWTDPGEQVLANQPLNDGANSLQFMMPAGAVSGRSYMRFRLGSEEGLEPTGGAADGEVEDYAVELRELDFGDAPEVVDVKSVLLGAPVGYPTFRFLNGAGHVLVSGFSLGVRIDGEVDGQSSGDALGDDGNGDVDEDGITFVPAVAATWPPLLNAKAGAVQEVTVEASLPAGTEAFLNAWLDFDGNGNWFQPGEQIFSNEPIGNGMTTLTFVMPSKVTAGVSFARFRLSTEQNLTTLGLAADGEVEDYVVDLQRLDYGDALMTHGGAPHIRPPKSEIFLGGSVDSDLKFQASPNANGDDGDPDGDDEDGVVFRGPLVAGLLTTVEVVANRIGELYFWIDYNGNGVFELTPPAPDPSELVNDLLQNPADRGLPVLLTRGSNIIRFFVPNRLVSKPAMARFRFNTKMPVVPDPTGLFPDGEVEDYEVQLHDLLTDFGDAPDSQQAPQYPTLLINDGAFHLVETAGYHLGEKVDVEINGFPGEEALGDDFDDGRDFPETDNPDDEDGVVFLTALVPGQTASIEVTATMTLVSDGKLSAWIDFSGDGDWLDAGEKVLSDAELVRGQQRFDFPVPTDARLGRTYARFRMSRFGGLAPNGFAETGEVEDYAVEIAAGTGSPEAPTAGDDTQRRFPDSSIKVLIADLLANDSDPDGDAVSLVRVNQPSSGQATTGVLGDHVTYLPDAGFRDADSYTYVIADTAGNEAVGTVHVEVIEEVAMSQNLLGVVPRADGSVLVRFAGIPLQWYQIRFTESLDSKGESTDWTALGKVQANSLGFASFIHLPTHTPPPNGTSGFYSTTSTSPPE